MSLMAKNENQNNNRNGNNNFFFNRKLTFGQRAADGLARFGGSWFFIIFLLTLLVIWAIINSLLLAHRPFDPYPYIMLNLLLSCLAALHGPIILMSQNRLAENDRMEARYDYQVNRKAEQEIQQVRKELRQVQKMVKELCKR